MILKSIQNWPEYFQTDFDNSSVETILSPWITWLCGLLQRMYPVLRPRKQRPIWSSLLKRVCKSKYKIWLIYGIKKTRNQNQGITIVVVLRCFSGCSRTFQSKTVELVFEKGEMWHSWRFNNLTSKNVACFWVAKITTYTSLY